MAEALDRTRPAESRKEIPEYLADTAADGPHEAARHNGNTHRALEILRELGQNVPEHFASVSRDWGRRSRHLFLQLKRERPLQLLGVVAGVTFVLGFSLGLWRSHKHE